MISKELLNCVIVVVARLEKQCEMCRNEHEKELKYALKVSQKNEENLRANLENKATGIFTYALYLCIFK